MKKSKIIIVSIAVFLFAVVTSGYTLRNSNNQKSETLTVVDKKQSQTINLFVTHGHCSTPFGGNVGNLKINAPKRDDLGNPLENMRISFEVDPNSFNVCAGEELTARIKTPGLFIGENNEKIIFRSTNVYTMGIDWYQVNGKMTIKGVEREVKLFVTGIRDSKEEMASSLVLEGRMDLYDWGIDYDLIVNGESDDVPNKWMFINMKIDLS